MADTSVSEAFPAVPASTLVVILDDFELVPSAPVVDLLSPGASGALAVLADYLIDNVPDQRLDQIAPGVGQDSRILLPLHVLSTRPANGLRRSGVSTWNELACLTPGDLLRLPALGRKSVSEIVALALQVAAMQLVLGPNSAAAALSAAEPGESNAEDAECDISTPATPHRPGISASGIPVRASPPGLGTLARWAMCVGNAATVGEALELAVSRILPEDVARDLDALKATSLEGLSEEGPTLAVGQALSLLWAQCGDERQQEIFRRRTLFNSSTLEDLGEEMSLTRERVRQIQKAAEAKVSAALERPEASEIRWRSVQLRQELGTAIFQASPIMRQALNAATRGIPHDTAVAEALLLWLAGPYRLDKQTGWLFSEKEHLRGEVGPQSELGPPPQASLLHGVTGDEGVVDLAAARSRAAAAGLVADAVDDWIALCPFRDFDGTLLLWHGNVADKADALLGILRRPATANELNDLIGEGHSVRSIRNRLLDDDRFVRTDRFRVGLHRWGLEEYTGIVDEIEQEIERRGGEADVDDLVWTLTKQFDLRSGSVVSYTTVPRFVVDKGRIHVRRTDEPFVPNRTLFDESGAFLLDEDRCSYRVRVDHELLRGSGRPLPQGVGAWLGVHPGNRRQFRFRDDNVLLISWPDSALLGPALGSLRRQALARSADVGDFLLLEFDRSSDEVEAMLVRQSELEAATGWLQGTLLTGIDAGNKIEFEQMLAVAIGASSAAETRRRCRDRGDPELAMLVRTESSPELDAAMERLREVL
jgi:hypothetical protein